jgi:hypothetical protein
MSPKPILTEIKERLLSGGELPQAQRHFLIDAITRYDNGEPLEAAFTHATLPEVKRGKSSPTYRAAERLRNARLRQALEFMPGPSEWKKCEELAELGSKVAWWHRNQRFVPATEPEKILVAIIEAGGKVPATGRAIKSAITEKSNRS